MALILPTSWESRIVREDEFLLRIPGGPFMSLDGKLRLPPEVNQGWWNKATAEERMQAVRDLCRGGS